MKNKWKFSGLVGFVALGMLSACVPSHPTTSSLRGTWSITGMTPASLGSDTIKSIRDLISLFVVDDSLRPNTLRISEKDLVLRSAAGDSAMLAYSLTDATNGRFIFQTTEGTGTFAIDPSDGATLVIAGATYNLKRRDKEQ